MSIYIFNSNNNLKVNWVRRRVQGELIAAYKVNETWTGINIYTLSISTQNEGSVEINANAFIGCEEPDIIEERPQKRQW